MRISNTNLVDEPVQKTEGDMPCNDGSFRYSHPSYGMISVSRSSSNTKEPLFGSEVATDSVISIKLSQACVEQSVGRNWYFDKQVIAEAKMTSHQYAELISNPNTQGTPCTIHYRSDLGRIKYRAMDTQVEYVESKIERQSSKLKKDVTEKMSDISELLNRKGAMKVSEKQELLGKIVSLTRQITSDLPFYETCMKENIEKMKSQAQIEIDSMVAHAITKAGIEVLNNPEAFKLLLEDKGD